MKQISLTSLYLSNFRSFTEPTTINFSTGSGLKLITGSNEAEPRLGANGCGKSSIWDSVCFALYGTSVKGLRPSDLITAGQQTVTASLEFWVSGECHTISRTAPPMRLYLDGQPVEQPAVDNLLGLSKARFLNSVVFGQSMPLFIDLPMPSRGDLLDEVLDLELWMRAAGTATEKHREATNTLIEVRRSMARTAGRIEGLGDLGRFAAQQEGWQATKTAKLHEYVTLMIQLEAAMVDLDAEYASADLAPVDEDTPKERHEYFQTQHTRAREKIAAINTELKGIIENIQTLEDTDTCPLCDQLVTTEHLMAHNARVQPRIDELEKAREIAILDSDTTRAEIAASEATWKGAVRTNNERRAARSTIQRRREDTAHRIDRLEREAERLAEEADPYAAEAARAQQEHATLTAALATQQAEEAALVTQSASLDYWRQGFRRVRLYCLERVLQELTLETRNSLLALGLAGWQIEFQTASETKSGTVKLGVQIDIKAPGTSRRFEMMSGGEAQRARLAVSLGLANLIQRWAGVRFDLEVFDEPTAFLASEGISDLLEALTHRAESQQKSIWVCDHRALELSSFIETMQIIKNDKGSCIQ